MGSGRSLSGLETVKAPPRPVPESSPSTDIDPPRAADVVGVGSLLLLRYGPGRFAEHRARVFWTMKKREELLLTQPHDQASRKLLKALTRDKTDVEAHYEGCSWRRKVEWQIGAMIVSLAVTSALWYKFFYPTATAPYDFATSIVGDFSGKEMAVSLLNI